ncbi:MAG TPA: hypothetical protein VHB77_13200, partial [Planctomycetaceae bacterium]|nr:hypothetical protein [Planctomycetaceae bacterium]
WEGPVVLRMVAVTKSDNWNFTKLNDTAMLRLEWKPGPEPHWVVKIPPEVVAEVMQARDKLRLHGQGWADRSLPPSDLPPNYVPNGVEPSAPGYSAPDGDLPPGPRTVPEPLDEERPVPPGAPVPLYNEPSTPADDEPGRTPDSLRARSPAGRG